MELRYSGFWSRSASLLIDGLLSIPFALIIKLLLKAQQASQIGTILTSLISTCLMWIILVWMVLTFGGTPGKLIVGIRIRKLSGDKITIREALLRASVDMVFSFLLIFAFIIPIYNMDYEYYLHFTEQFKHRYFEAFTPSWYKPIYYLDKIWIISESIVLLFNKKRRALHDFIAGTIVVHMPLKLSEIRNKFYQKIGSSENIDRLLEEED